MTGIHFENPQWIHAVWAVAGIAIALIAIDLRSTSLLERFLSPKMQQRLVRRTSTARRLTARILFCAALLALVIALMRPQFGGTLQAMTRVDSQVMVCLDVSKSMLAEDVVPNRLERAKAELDSLLSLLSDGQQVGLLAFAGKATVLCPMTTDFGFLRLILAETSPASVGLGGTKIGDAIRVAVDGFRAGGDINRLLLVITDGEDHESFPLDAAAYAKEKGVRIVSIGFGDEQGSKIQITNPQTGSRDYVTDRNGTPVVSRLDGETLREIALETEGAYIPAGTGALDLESIYESHIKTMLQGSSSQEQRIVRNEAFQWLVLFAILLWAASLLVGSPRKLPPPNVLSYTAAAIFLWVATCFGSPALLADDVANKSTSDSKATPELAAPEVNSEGDAPAVLPPREVYNQALQAMAGDPDTAEKLLTESRTRAGVDGELRFRAVYNLGWVDVARADKLLEESPEDALKHLNLASGRFREAIRLRPDSNEARQNLEIVSLRILELADSLANKNPKDIAQQLDDVITALADHLSELQNAVENAAAADQSPDSEKHIRAAYRKLGITQRLVISQLDEVAAAGRVELESASKQKDDAAGPEQAIRGAQLTAMLNYLDRAMNWMSKSRSFTRRLQSNPAFLRWASALRDARQARDQLRDPVEILSNIIADSTELEQMTRGKGQLEQAGPAASSQLPAWLSTDFLSQTQAHTIDRTQQLRDIFQHASQSQAAAGSAIESTPGQGTAPGQAGAEQELRESLTEAVPKLDAALGAFTTALAALETNLGDAANQQLEAIVALNEAAELFFDLRRLIEVSYAAQMQVQAGMLAGNQQPALPLDALAAAIGPLQAKNVSRAQRLDVLLRRAMVKLAAAPESASPQNPPNQPAGQDDAQSTAQRERLTLALELVAAVQEKMQRVDTQLATVKTRPVPEPAAPQENPVENPQDTEDDNAELKTVDDASDSTPEPPANQAADGQSAQSEAARSRLLQVAPVYEMTDVDQAVEDLESLRRLFFSIVEHLKDTANRQSSLNQDTTEAATQPDDPNVRGPLAQRQLTLEQTTAAIADALQQQAEQEKQAADAAAARPTPAPNGQPNQSTAENAEKLASASVLVADAVTHQSAARVALASPLAAAPGEAADADDTAQTNSTNAAPATTNPGIEKSQLAALEKLVEALKILDPPKEDPDQDQQDQDKSQDEQSEDSPGEDEQPNDQSQDQKEDGKSGEQETPSQNMTAEQMLQAIRDREAQRRGEREKARIISSGQVEKDW